MFGNNVETSKFAVAASLCRGVDHLPVSTATQRRGYNYHCAIGAAYGLGPGVGRGLGVGSDRGVGVGRGVGVAVGVDVAVGVAVGVAVAVAVAVGVGLPQGTTAGGVGSAHGGLGHTRT